MKLTELKTSTNYKKHHTAWTQGYVSRKISETEPIKYKGKFGKGYITYSPSWRSTQYCYINYYIEVR